MKAEELMVGDWVHYKMGLGKDGIYEKDIRINNIYGSEVNCELRGYEIISGKSSSNLYPIPLTKEILEKNGFVINRGPTSWKFETEREDLIDIYGCWDYHLSINIEDTHGSGKGYRWMLNDFVIHYVHELQHALRLFRIEKEIMI